MIKKNLHPGPGTLFTCDTFVSRTRFMLAAPPALVTVHHHPPQPEPERVIIDESKCSRKDNIYIQ